MQINSAILAMYKVRYSSCLEVIMDFLMGSLRGFQHSGSPYLVSMLTMFHSLHNKYLKSSSKGLKIVCFISSTVFYLI